MSTDTTHFHHDPTMHSSTSEVIAIAAGAAAEMLLWLTKLCLFFTVIAATSISISIVATTSVGAVAVFALFLGSLFVSPLHRLPTLPPKA